MNTILPAVVSKKNRGTGSLRALRTLAMKSHVFFTACRSLLMVAFSALPGWAALHAQDRVALVIGNNDYDEGGNFPDLDNCVHDAALIKDTLEAVHFKVFFLENATRSQMDETLESFESSITKGSTAVFYFAGHGIEFNGKNYLMGTNAKLQARSRLGEEAMDAETFAGAMMLAGAKSSFLFLDCCREVPNDAGWLTRGIKKRGLAELHVDGDIIIAYAAKPGQSALDGQDGNSPYAKALAKWLPSGLKHGDMFEKVRLEVHEATGGAQRTWETGSFLTPFFFSDSPGKAIASGSGTVPPVTVAPVMTDPKTVGNGRDEGALKTFQSRMRKVLLDHPNTANDLDSYRKRTVAVVRAMEEIPLDALPKDLQEAFSDFLVPMQTEAGILAEIPADFPYGKPDEITVWSQRVGRTNPDLVARVSSIPTLEQHIQTAGLKVDGIMAKYGIFIPDTNTTANPAQSAGRSPMTRQEALLAFKNQITDMVQNNPAPNPNAGNAAQMRYLKSLANRAAKVNTEGLPEDLKQAYEEFANPLIQIRDVLDELPDNLPWDDDKAMYAFGERLAKSDPALGQRLIAVGSLANDFEAAGTKVDQVMAKYGILVPSP